MKSRNLIPGEVELVKDFAAVAYIAAQEETDGIKSKKVIAKVSFLIQERLHLKSENSSDVCNRTPNNRENVRLINACNLLNFSAPDFAVAFTEAFMQRNEATFPQCKHSFWYLPFRECRITKYYRNFKDLFEH